MSKVVEMPNTKAKKAEEELEKLLNLMAFVLVEDFFRNQNNLLNQ